MTLQARDVLHAEIAALRAEVEELREQIRQRDAAEEPTLLFPRSWRLTKREQQLLLILMQGDHTKTKERLFSQVWGNESDRDVKSLDVYICKLRKKLSHRSIEIRTEWGVGYYCPPPSITLLRAALEGEAA